MSIFTLGCLFEVESELQDITSQWKSFGRALHINPSRLEEIKLDNKESAKECLSKTLREFLKKNYDWDKYGEPSWRLIVRAVADRAGGNNPGLASELAEKYRTGEIFTYVCCVIERLLIFAGLCIDGEYRQKRQRLDSHGSCKSHFLLVIASFTACPFSTHHICMHRPIYFVDNSIACVYIY